MNTVHRIIRHAVEAIIVIIMLEALYVVQYHITHCCNHYLSETVPLVELVDARGYLVTYVTAEDMPIKDAQGCIVYADKTIYLLEDSVQLIKYHEYGHAYSHIVPVPDELTDALLATQRWWVSGDYQLDNPDELIAQGVACYLECEDYVDTVSRITGYPLNDMLKEYIGYANQYL